MALPSDAEIRRLAPQERIRLIEMLWASFVDEPQTLPVTDAQREELRRRVADFESNPNDTRPWSQVRAELEADSE